MVESVEGALEARGLVVRCHALEQKGTGRLAVTLEVRGAEHLFRSAREELVERPDVHAVRVH